MKKQTLTKIIAALLLLSMLFATSCGTVTNIADEAKKDGASVAETPESGTADEIVDNSAPVGEYKEGVVLVKYDGEMNDTVLSQLDVASAEPLYTGSTWYSLELKDASKTVETVSYLRELGCFDKVDYDYIMGTTGPKEDAEKNPNYDDQVNLGLSNIPNGWTHNGKAPGGSPDVVVAVIDTGVDYNHLDLRNNIWVNSAEIPDNGKDDDGNGYIDDVYGWDCVGNDKDPMDDNGHGTHVAGIIAAENNKEGGIGVAYNCKVMVLKAGNSSGYFNNSDIAEAIQYAYMNGASVINMSFGGSNISIAVEEALENAYNTSVLVAAAGNDGACNNLACKECDKVGVSYPAALPYVIGVMSVDKDGKHLSSFSNYDHNPYDSIEYEVYAVGEGVGSTWPSNKYACLNGTSMAAPTVAGIAALLRSYYTDRDMYSTKFIQSQIVNTGKENPHLIFGKEHVTDMAHSVADAHEALTQIPKPSVNLYGYKIDDSVSISENNNGNGVIDAGEIVRLYIELQNRGGVASNVNVSIDTYRSQIGDEAMTDPYFTFVNSTMLLSDIGTYSVRDSSTSDNYFEIIVDSKCPNDYLVDFNIRFTYENGLDSEDKTTYDGDGIAQFNVSHGFHLPATITEDTVYKADKLYIVGQNVVIPEGVTVTFEEGCEIQFYDDREYYNSPNILVYGALYFYGTEDNMINIAPSERFYQYTYTISLKESAILRMEYASTINLSVVDYSYNSTFVISKSHLKIHGEGQNVYKYASGKIDYSGVAIVSSIDRNKESRIDSCYIDMTSRSSTFGANAITNSFIHYYTNNYVDLRSTQTDGNAVREFTNNIFFTEYSGYGNETYVVGFNSDSIIQNNMFQSSNDKNSKSLAKFRFRLSPNNYNNLYSSGYQNFASQIIEGYIDKTGTPTVDVYGSLADASLLWPHVVSIEMFDADGNPITTVGREEIKVRVTFNRPMDVNAGTFMTFGTIEPYGDYRIDGEYISDTVWEGTYTLKAQIENGQNFLMVNNAWAAEDQTKTVFGEYQLHEFTIDTTAAMSMNLQANPTENGIELNFVQDDYDTLLGYNVYRSTDKDGNYVKLNPTILLPNELTFLDENAEPGKTYWYTYTVVLTDFTESNPAGKVQATAMDTVAPSIYHTPVNQGYMNNNLVISCTASDNVAISTVTLYYRTVGSTEWKTLSMAKQSDKYSATVFGSELSLDGLEYYIVATDGINTINKGSAEAPYTVVIKDASAISRKGDVDGDGVVTTKDALMLMQHINETKLLTDDEFKRADLNGDGVLNSSEALRILQYINGKVNTLEM